MTETLLEKLRLLFVLPFVATFIISGLTVNLIQLVLWLVLWNINPWLYRKINYYLIYAIWSQILFISHWWSNSQCYVHTDDKSWKKMQEEHAIVLMNHSYEVDWLMGWTVCEERSVLASSKVLIKKEIEWVPVIGWTWKFAEVIFLHRNWDKDREHLKNSTSVLGNYPDPVWLLIFPEGTRFTKEKHEKGVEYARKNNLPELKHMLLPRVKGFSTVAQLLKGKFAAVYDCTMGFDTKSGAVPTLKNMLMGRRVVSDMYLKRIPLEELPESEEDLNSWLYASFKEKDERLDMYKKTGSFSLNGEVIQKQSRDRRLAPLLNAIGWNVLIMPTLLRSFWSLLTSGLYSLGIGLLLVIGVSFALYKFVGLTKIRSASLKKTN